MFHPCPEQTPALAAVAAALCALCRHLSMRCGADWLSHMRLLRLLRLYVALLSRHPAFSLQLSTEMGATFILAVCFLYCAAVCCNVPCVEELEQGTKSLESAAYERLARLIGSGSFKGLKCDLMTWRGRLVGAHGLNISLF
eukprot:s664_g5.t1